MKGTKALKVIAGAPDRPLVMGDIEIPCYVLEDETRVLSQRGLQSSIGLGTGGGNRGAPKIVEFLSSLESKGLDIKGLYARTTSMIEFHPPSGRTAYAYPATMLVELCEIVLEARDLGILTKQQESTIALRADILIRGFATVGIIALVDEVTGYQHIREERALATILEKFIAEELQPWTKTFPYEFYKQIARLKGWPTPTSTKRPSVLGHYTNDFVYDRLPYGVLEELRRRNPSDLKGYRRSKHHQWFNPEIGYPKLKEHLYAVIALMKAAPNWESFKRSMARALPKQEEQMILNLDEEDLT